MLKSFQWENISRNAKGKFLFYFTNDWRKRRFSVKVSSFVSVVFFRVHFAKVLRIFLHRNAKNLMKTHLIISSIAGIYSLKVNGTLNLNDSFNFFLSFFPSKRRKRKTLPFNVSIISRRRSLHPRKKTNLLFDVCCT